MTRRERAHAHDVHVVLHGLTGRLFRSLKEGADVNIKAQVGEAGSDNLLTAIMAVLTHLCHKDPWTPTFALQKLAAQLTNPPYVRAVGADLGAVDPAHDAHRGRVPAKGSLE